MALIVCPECNAEISQHSEICIKCGFPIQKFMKENNLNNFDSIKICPVCGRTSGDMPDILPINLKCEKCGTIVVQTDISLKEQYKVFTVANEREDTARIANKYGGNRFSYEMYDKWISKHHNNEYAIPKTDTHSTTQPKCPTCGSKNIEKISAGKKVAGMIGFGLFSKTAKSQFCCKDCGYKW